LSLQIGYAKNEEQSKKDKRKGSIYIYWGWNRSLYTNSDIHFNGTNYNFILESVVATDRQTRFDPKTYFHPLKITIPQVNYRIGYCIGEKYDISIGVDHMKYVVKTKQDVSITGEIKNSGTSYDGIYNNDNIKIENGFLQFEHTDGLNYINLEYKRFDNILTYKEISLNLTEGIGIGILIPKTNSKLLQNKRNDQYYLAGYGCSSVFAINISYKNYFIQTEVKGGFITMPNIRTTENQTDRASQSFYFSQLNFLIGTTINLIKKK
jgi:hypothetical protein